MHNLSKKSLFLLDFLLNIPYNVSIGNKKGRKPMKTKTLTVLVIGIVIGVLLPFVVDLVLFEDPTPLNITKQYEDGSFVGCIAKSPCND